MKKWITPVFWSLVSAIGLCLVMSVVTAVQESKQAAATVQTTNIIVPAQ